MGCARGVFAHLARIMVNAVRLLGFSLSDLRRTSVGKTSDP